MTKQVTSMLGPVVRSRIFRVQAELQRRPNNHKCLVGLRGAGQRGFDC